MKIKNNLVSNVNLHIEILNNQKIYYEKKAEEFSKEIINCFLKGGKIFIIGNGGSAADAQHFATELTVKMKKYRRGLPAISLATDSSAITAIGNDFDFNKIFSRQCEALMSKKDILISISTSGKSKNIIEALKYVKKKKIQILNILGNNGGIAKNYSDFNLIVDSRDASRIQEIHIIFYQNLCEIIENYFYKKKKIRL